MIILNNNNKIRQIHNIAQNCIKLKLLEVSKFQNLIK